MEILPHVETGDNMRSNSNSVSTLQYQIIWCTKYRHPILTGAVEVETKTIHWHRPVQSMAGPSRP